MPPEIDSLITSGRLGLTSIGVVPVAVVLLFAAAGCFIAGQIYLLARRGRETGIGVHRAAPLMGVAVTALLVTVQFSLPLSLGLLAALTLIRVRTPIKEPEEPALVMLVMATSVAAASLTFTLLAALLTAALLAAVVAPRVWASRPGLQAIRVRLCLPSAATARDRERFATASAACQQHGVLQTARSTADGLAFDFIVHTTGADGAAAVTRLAQQFADVRIDVGAPLSVMSSD